MNASKFIAVAALATAFGGSAFAGSLSYNDGVVDVQAAQAKVSTVSRNDVQAQAAQYVNAHRGLAYSNVVVYATPTAQTIRSRDDVRAEAAQASRGNHSLSEVTGA